MRQEVAMRALSSVFLPLVLLICVASSSQAADWRNQTFIENSFYEIALGSEHGVAAYEVRKWNKPMRIYVEHQVADRQLHDDLLNAQIEDLRKVTGLSITRVKRKQDANVRYYFTSQQKLTALVRANSGASSVKTLHGAVCMATVSSGHNGSIHRGIVYIPVDQARMHAKLVSCIVEELTQVMGLPRDSDLVYPSIFNDKTPNSTLTGLDIALLKILYSPQVKAGMGRRQLRPVIRPIIKRMLKAGTGKLMTESRSMQMCQYVDC